MYPHLPAGVLPPNLQQQLLFQQTQQTYGQMQQQAQVYGGAPPQQINLQLQQPTMQMQPVPVQQPYTRKPRGRNAIRVINPDTGNEILTSSIRWNTRAIVATLTQNKDFKVCKSQTCKSQATPNPNLITGCIKMLRGAWIIHFVMQ